MWKQAFYVFELKSMMHYNSIAYYCTKLPLLGGIFDRLLLQNRWVKKVIILLGAIFVTLNLTAVKLLGALFVSVLPIFWYAANYNPSFSIDAACFFHIIFFFYCVWGAFQESRTFLPSKIKYICLTQAKMNTRNCLFGFLISDYAIQFLSILFAFGLCHFVLFHNVIFTISLIVSYIALQLTGESVHLLYYQKTGRPLERNIAFSVLLALFSLLAAYAALFLPTSFLVYNIVATPVSILLFGLLIPFNVWYIIHFYRAGNADHLQRFFSKSGLVEMQQQKALDEMYHQDVSITFADDANSSNLSGYAQLHRLFIARTRQTIKKSIYLRFGAILSCFLLLAIYAILDFELIQTVFCNLALFVSIIPIVTPLVSFGTSYCKFCYQNMDYPLLAYPFYRTKSATRVHSFCKLKDITSCNILLAFTMIGAILLFMLVLQVPILTQTTGWLVLLIFLWMCMLGVHHLSIYYLLQPYVHNSAVQNPVLMASNMPFILLGYALFLMQLSLVQTATILLVIAIVYPIVLIGLLLCKGGKTFRAK